MYLRQYFLIIGLFSQIALATIPEKICCSLFGSQDMSLANQKIFIQALHDFNIDYMIPLKKIRDNSPAYIQQFSSFTWFGIWINEEHFNAMALEEKIFSAYHEAAHYKYYHPTALLCLDTAVAATAANSLYLIVASLLKNVDHRYMIKSGLISFLLAFITPKLHKICELEAHKHAVLKLLMTNQKYVVDYMLEKLYKDLNQSNNSNINSIWLPSIQTQIEAIEKALH